MPKACQGERVPDKSLLFNTRVHKTAEELFAVVRVSRVGEADERTIDGCPSCPFHLCDDVFSAGRACDGTCLQ